MLVRRVLTCAATGVALLAGSATAAAAAYPPVPPGGDTPPVPGLVCGDSGAPAETVMVTVGSTPKAVTIKPGDRVVISADAVASTTVVVDPPQADPVTLTLDPGSTRTITLGPCTYTDTGSYSVQVLAASASPVEVRVLAASAGLADTGSSTLETALPIGGLLVLVGGAIVALSVRRRRPSSV